MNKVNFISEDDNVNIGVNVERVDFAKPTRNLNGGFTKYLIVCLLIALFGGPFQL